MKIFTRQEKSLVMILAFGLLSGIGVKYFKGGFDTNNSKLEFVELDEEINEFYINLNDSTHEINKKNNEEFIININSAQKKELIKLSGIGPSLAERIIKKRQEIGKFNSIDELKIVKGIGDKIIERNLNNISIEDN